MRADWLLPDDKKLEVTLKILKSESHLEVNACRKLEKCLLSFYFK